MEPMMNFAATTPNRFSSAELNALRTDLLQNGVDHWQAAEMLSLFLSGRGYGVSRQRAREALSRLEGSGCTVANIERELNGLALMA